jgi:hypothetical protein
MNASGPETVMTAAKPAQEKLRQAIESLRTDIDRVEFWADALDGWTKPIPEYQQSERLSQHLLPQQSPRKGNSH